MDLETCLISFTGKLFYRPTIHPEGQEASRDGWLLIGFTPVERFGAYSPSPEVMLRYYDEFGRTGQDPVVGTAHYPYYNILLDTGIIAVRGRVRFMQHKQDEHGNCQGWLCDYRDTAAPIRIHAAG